MRAEPEDDRALARRARSSRVEHVKRGQATRRSTASTSTRRSATRRRRDANLHIDPEERSIALYQAARYSRDCRVFAPMYRQITLAGAAQPADVTPGRAGDRPTATCATRLAHLPAQVQQGPRRRADRPLAGHLRAAPADRRRRSTSKPRCASGCLGAPARRQRDGEEGQGRRAATSSTSRACRSKRQLGCVIAFSTFDATPPRPARCSAARGARRREVLCTNPAALGGGSGTLRRRSSRPRRSRPGPRSARRSLAVGVPVPERSTPWVEFPNAYTARCSSAANAQRPADPTARRRADAQRGPDRELGPAPRRREHRARQPRRPGAPPGGRVRQIEGVIGWPPRAAS